MDNQTINDIYDNLDGISRICDDIDFDCEGNTDAKRDVEALRVSVANIEALLWAAQQKTTLEGEDD